MSAIFCLFSVDNNYDQPDNNLVMWWPNKPSIETVAKALGFDLALPGSDEIILDVANIWAGQERAIAGTGTRYRIVTVAPGQPVKER